MKARALRKKTYFLEKRQLFLLKKKMAIFLLIKKSRPNSGLHVFLSLKIILFNFAKSEDLIRYHKILHFTWVFTVCQIRKIMAFLYMYSPHFRQESNKKLHTQWC